MRETLHKYTNKMVKTASVRLGSYDVGLEKVLEEVEKLRNLGYLVEKMYIEGEVDGYDDAVEFTLTAQKTLEGEEELKAISEEQEKELARKFEVEKLERQKYEELKAKYEGATK